MFRPHCIKKCTLLIRNTAFAISILTSNLAFSEPLTLTDDQLDTVSAGYVNLFGNANAEAHGVVAIAKIQVNAVQTITQTDEGITQTTSTVNAQATAIGESVKTSVTAGFDTDETVVALEVQHTSTAQTAVVIAPSADRSYGGRYNPWHYYRRGGRNSGGQRQPVVVQRESVRLTVVTTTTPSRK